MKKKRVEKKEIVKNSKKLFEDFKKFISRGNVIELAVGVIIGTAFGKIVTSLVNDVLMPFIGAIGGGVDFSELSVQIGDSTIKYGAFIQNIIDFLIVAVCIFVLTKIIEGLNGKKEETIEKVEEVVEVKKDEHLIILEEIRDLLKERKEESKV